MLTTPPPHSAKKNAHILTFSFEHDFDAFFSCATTILSRIPLEIRDLRLINLLLQPFVLQSPRPRRKCADICRNTSKCTHGRAHSSAFFPSFFFFCLLNLIFSSFIVIVPKFNKQKIFFLQIAAADANNRDKVQHRYRFNHEKNPLSIRNHIKFPRNGYDKLLHPYSTTNEQNNDWQIQFSTFANTSTLRQRNNEQQQKNAVNRSQYNSWKSARFLCVTLKPFPAAVDGGSENSLLGESLLRPKSKTARTKSQQKLSRNRRSSSFKQKPLLFFHFEATKRNTAERPTNNRFVYFNLNAYLPAASHTQYSARNSTVTEQTESASERLLVLSTVAPRFLDTDRKNRKVLLLPDAAGLTNLPAYDYFRPFEEFASCRGKGVVRRLILRRKNTKQREESFLKKRRATTRRISPAVHARRGNSNTTIVVAASNNTRRRGNEETTTTTTSNVPEAAAFGDLTTAPLLSAVSSAQVPSTIPSVKTTIKVAGVIRRTPPTVNPTTARRRRRRAETTTPRRALNRSTAHTNLFELFAPQQSTADRRTQRNKFICSFFRRRRRLPLLLWLKPSGTLFFSSGNNSTSLFGCSLFFNSLSFNDKSSSRRQPHTGTSLEHVVQNGNYSGSTTKAATRHRRVVVGPLSVRHNVRRKKNSIWPLSLARNNQISTHINSSHLREPPTQQFERVTTNPSYASTTHVFSIDQRPVNVDDGNNIQRSDNLLLPADDDKADVLLLLNNSTGQQQNYITKAEPQQQNHIVASSTVDTTRLRTLSIHVSATSPPLSPPSSSLLLLRISPVSITRHNYSYSYTHSGRGGNSVSRRAQQHVSAIGSQRRNIHARQAEAKTVTFISTSSGAAGRLKLDAENGARHSLRRITNSIYFNASSGEKNSILSRIRTLLEKQHEKNTLQSQSNTTTKRHHRYYPRTYENDISSSLLLHKTRKEKRGGKKHHATTAFFSSLPQKINDKTAEAVATSRNYSNGKSQQRHINHSNNTNNNDSNVDLVLHSSVTTPQPAIYVKNNNDNSPTTLLSYILSLFTSTAAEQLFTDYAHIFSSLFDDDPQKPHQNDEQIRLSQNLRFRRHTREPRSLDSVNETLTTIQPVQTEIESPPTGLQITLSAASSLDVENEKFYSALKAEKKSTAIVPKTTAIRANPIKVVHTKTSAAQTSSTTSTSTYELDELYLTSTHAAEITSALLQKLESYRQLSYRVCLQSLEKEFAKASQSSSNNAIGPFSLSSAATSREVGVAAQKLSYHSPASKKRRRVAALQNLRKKMSYLASMAATSTTQATAMTLSSQFGNNETELLSIGGQFNATSSAASFLANFHSTMTPMEQELALMVEQEQQRMMDELDWRTVLNYYYYKYHGYVQLTVICFAAMFNLINVIVFSRPRMRTPTNFLLMFLAISDGLIAIEFLPFTVYYTFLLPTNSSLRSYNWAVYTIFHGTWSITLHCTSIWITAAVAFFRSVAVLKPEKMSQWCTLSRARIIALVCFISTCFLCVPPVSVSYGISPVQRPRPPETISELQYVTTPSFPGCLTDTAGYTVLESDFSKRHANIPLQITFWMFSIIVKVIPSFVFTIFSMLIIRGLRLAKRRREALHNRNVTAVGGRGGGAVGVRSGAQLAVCNSSSVLQTATNIEDEAIEDDATTICNNSNFNAHVLAEHGIVCTPTEEEIAPPRRTMDSESNALRSPSQRSWKQTRKTFTLAMLSPFQRKKLDSSKPIELETVTTGFRSRTATLVEVPDIALDNDEKFRGKRDNANNEEKQRLLEANNRGITGAKLTKHAKSANSSPMLPRHAFSRDIPAFTKQLSTPENTKTSSAIHVGWKQSLLTTKDSNNITNGNVHQERRPTAPTFLTVPMSFHNINTMDHLHPNGTTIATHITRRHSEMPNAARNGNRRLLSITSSAHGIPIHELPSSVGGAKSTQQHQPKSTPTKRRVRTSSDRMSILVMIMLLLFVCTEAPAGVMALLAAFMGDNFKTRYYEPLGNILDLLTLFHSLTNFLLYVIMSADFRDTLADLLRSCCFCVEFLKPKHAPHTRT